MMRVMIYWVLDWKELNYTDQQGNKNQKVFVFSDIHQ
jgi:hypothetical protein